MSTKERLSASVDSDLLKAAEDAVNRGLSASISAWVNDALRLKRDHEIRLNALADFVTAFEREHGEITANDIRAAERRARARAVAVRAVPEARRTAPRKKGR